MASRKSAHKMKSVITDKREKRLLRVHRRSLDQREMRQEEINKRRQLDDMSPVMESQEGSKNPSSTATPVNQNAGQSRLDKLKKWKEERELKRKIEAMEKAHSKPGFKVMHVTYKENQLFQKMVNKDSAKSATAKPVPAIPAKAAKPKARTAPPSKETTATTKPMPVDSAKAAKPKAGTAAVPTKATNKAATTRSTIRTTSATRTTASAQPPKKPDAPVTRATRSRGTAGIKTVSPVAQKKAKKSSPKRPVRSNFMAPTASSRTRAVAATKKEAAPVATATEKKTRAGQPRGRVPKAVGKVSTQRGEAHPPAQSFAPNDFVFEAPSNVSSFVFKPLSPASAASFLFPQGSANKTTMSAFTDRVGRTSTPKHDAPPVSNSDEDNSDGTKSSSRYSSEEANPFSERSRSKPRQSSVNSAGASPTLAGKRVTNSRRGSGSVLDSGIEVNTAGVNSCSIKTMTQSLSENSTISAEEGEMFTADQECSGKKGKSTLEMDTQIIAVQEEHSIAEAERKTVEEKDCSSHLQSKKGSKRKSKHVTIQEDNTTEPEDLKEDMSAAKQRRKSRRSATKTESAMESVAENVQDSAVENAVTQPSLPEETEEQNAPSNTLHSQKSAAKLNLVLKEEVAPEENEEKILATRRSRRSRRSNLPKAGSSEESEPVVTEDKEIATEVPENTQAIAVPSVQKRRSRRSVAKHQEPVEDVISSQEEPVGNTKTVTLAETVQKEIEIPKPTTPENHRHNLRGKCSKDDMFLTPGLPVASQKRSTAKRRRTATMVALSSAKSPEEAIQIIATSPMVEMTRRTPKTKISPELRNQSTALLFDENDFALEPMQLSSAFDAVFCDATTSDDAAVTDSGATDNSETAHDQLATLKTQEATDCTSDSGNEKRDMTSVRERLSAEIQKLTQLCDHWTTIRETSCSLPEEVEGQIRTTVCQAQLLMDKKGKFHQFAGLVDKCEAGDPSTTCQDLQGFWDMIFIQAEDIYNKCNQLEQLQNNNWQPELTAAQTSKPVKKLKKPVAGGSKKDKPVVKSKFAAFKAQMMKQRKAQEENAGVGTMPEEKVFDAGFFKVNSPVRTPKYHCEAGTPSRHKSTKESTDPCLTPTTSKTSTSSKDTTPATSIATTIAVSPKTAENKENVAHLLLRRSVGATVGHRSYVPAIPSPLLKDGVPPVASSSNGAESKAETSEGDDVTEGAGTLAAGTPVRPRRSLTARCSTHSRKSVSFLEKLEVDSGGVEQEEDGVDLMAYLQPSTSQPTRPLKESVVDNSPFSCEDILKNNKYDTPVLVSPARQQSSGRQRKNSLKTLPSKERRQSRRSVSFAPSTSTSERSIVLPSTPYNRNSLAAGKRVTRHSMASPSQVEQSALSELQECSSTPPLRRSARPSLLYTPPKADTNKPRTPAKDVPIAKLISFSP